MAVAVAYVEAALGVDPATAAPCLLASHYEHRDSGQRQAVE
jgi:hypothetical protein